MAGLLLGREIGQKFYGQIRGPVLTASRLSNGPVIFNAPAYGRLRYLTTSSRMQGEHVKFTVKGDIGVITLDSPAKMNTLGFAVMKECKEVFDQVASNPSVKAAVLVSAKPDCFIAGADINMLEACKTAEEAFKISTDGQRMLQQIEDSKKPIVAAIMGPCMGGGLEVALACHYRIAVNNRKTVLAVPEVQLGLLPGGGGTQRLPKLVPIDQAFDMMLTGKSIRADKAKKMGLVDQVVDSLGPGLKPADDRTRDYLEEVAIQTAQGLANGSIKKVRRSPSLMERAIGFMLKYERGRKYFINQVKTKVMKQTSGVYPAPLRIIDVVETTLEKGLAEGYKAEARGFGDLAVTNECKALIGIYHGMTACKKNRFGKPQRPVKNVAVLGAGLMGAGIAQVSIDKGMVTALKDVAMPGLMRGQQQVEQGLKDQVRKKKITQFEADQTMSNLEPTLTFEDFGKMDMVIEAVFEDIKIKHAVLKEVEQHIPEHCIFASNTSALPITKIAEASKRPDKVIGMHYFSPVDKMMLLEIVTTDKTSKDTIASAVDVGLRQGKVVIVVKDGPGFYTSRCISTLLSEVVKLLQEGMSPKDLDRKSKAMGFPVGQATLIDEVGIDVGAHIAEYISGVFGKRMDVTEQDAKMMQEMVANGFLGKKTGKGIYLYDGKNREENPGAAEILKRYPLAPKLELTDEVLRMRQLGRFTNEAIMCLQEGIIASPLEGDIGMVFGIGFPAYLGGPFRFTDTYGADRLVAKLQELEAVYGERFTPCQLLLDYAKDPSKKFHAKV